MLHHQNDPTDLQTESAVSCPSKAQVAWTVRWMNTNVMIRPSIVDHSKASLLSWRHAVVPTYQSLHHDCNTHASFWLKDHNDSNWSYQGGNNQCDKGFCPSQISSKSRTVQILNQVGWSPRNPFLGQPATSSHQGRIWKSSISRNLVKGLWSTNIQDQASQAVSKLDILWSYCWNSKHACGQWVHQPSCSIVTCAN